MKVNVVDKTGSTGFYIEGEASSEHMSFHYKVSATADIWATNILQEILPSTLGNTIFMFKCINCCTYVTCKIAYPVAFSPDFAMDKNYKMLLRN